MYFSSSAIRFAWNLAKNSEREQIVRFIRGNEHLGDRASFFLIRLESDSGRMYLTAGLSLDGHGLKASEILDVFRGPMKRPPPI